MSYRSRFSSLFTYPPLTLGALAAIIEKVHPDWVIDAVDEISGRVRFDDSYDLVMLTATTPTVTRAYEIADKFREMGSYVCIGGYHVTYCREEVLQHADTIFICRRCLDRKKCFIPCIAPAKREYGN